ncbi:NUDIX domain-containing protein [Pseudomonas sp. v388]|uniref:NUDIX domain-containing protein n=1 Tax=Pseudomonas sp. v388 TaxID=2479849 RepID=UPI000F7A4F9B|nr:NUDIX domain-containing protein [Pseudomonas sp. v388]RRV10566.1 NUDIX domain-containing protein [Pseudomonas sp. v388]
MKGSIEQHGTVICLSNDKILLVRKKAPEWSLPGGKVEPGETPQQGAARELQEETRLLLSGAEFLGKHTTGAEEHHLYRLAISKEAVPMPGHEIVECRWFSPAELVALNLKHSNIELLKALGYIR